MIAGSFPNTEKKSRIGVMIREIEKLDNWEFRILKGVIEHPNLELCLFIKDGRKSPGGSAGSLFPNALLALQMKIESFLFKKTRAENSAGIIEQTKNVETINLEPVREGTFEVFSEEESGKVKAYDLDIILQLEFGNLSGSILKAARYGIWSFYYNFLSTRRFAGLLEIVNNEPCNSVILHNGSRVIDRAWFNLHWAFLRNNNDLLENSVALLFKNMDKLLKSGKIEEGEPISQYNEKDRNPNPKHILIYLFRFYSKVFSLLLRKLFKGKRTNCWTLFLGKGNFFEANLRKINPVSMPKGVFWADPFLYRHNAELYVFFETYLYKTGIGKLSAGRVLEENNTQYKVVDVVDILDLSYHLSYPQIFEEDGQLFLMPETYQNKRVETYRCAHFPEKWELYATAFEGEEIVDTTYYRDENGDRWLFLNKGWDFDSELYIYKIDSLKMENITAHVSNPVIVDCRRARSGGPIFRHNNELYRPSQINTHGIYGEGLQISKIKKLSLTEFEDEPVIAMAPNFRKGLIGMHHLHQYGNNFVIDACYKKL